MVNHEYRYDAVGIDNNPDVLFFKVSQAAGDLVIPEAVGHAVSQVEQTGLSLNANPAGAEAHEPPKKINLGDGRRSKLIERVFPEFIGLSDDAIIAILSAIPALVSQGTERLRSKPSLDKRVRILSSLLEGKSNREVAQEEGLPLPSAVSRSLKNLLIALRNNFSLEEIMSGRVIEDPDKTLLESVRRLLHTAYPDKDPPDIDLEEARLFASGLSEAARPKDQARIQKMLEGLNDFQIARSEGLKKSKIIWEWRYWIMKRKVGSNINLDSILAALQSDQPEEQLRELFQKISFGKPARKRAVKKTGRKKSSASRTSKKRGGNKKGNNNHSGPPPVKPGGKLGRSPESISFWKKVAKDLEKRRNKVPLVGDAFDDNPPDDPVEFEEGVLYQL